MRGKKDDYVSNVAKIIGDKIRKRRKVLGLSRESLAYETNVTHQQIYKYEHGKNNISLGRYLLICNALRVPYDYLLKDLDNKEVVEENQKAVIKENIFKHINKLKDDNEILIISNLVKTFKIKE